MASMAPWRPPAVPVVWPDVLVPDRYRCCAPAKQSPPCPQTPSANPDAPNVEVPAGLELTGNKDDPSKWYLR